MKWFLISTLFIIIAYYAGWNANDYNTGCRLTAKEYREFAKACDGVPTDYIVKALVDAVIDGKLKIENLGEDDGEY